MTPLQVNGNVKVFNGALVLSQSYVDQTPVDIALSGTTVVAPETDGPAVVRVSKIVPVGVAISLGPLDEGFRVGWVEADCHGE